jgi:tetratricopeptide (TPR) repeat protein
LWWANPAVHVNDDYQSVFPPDVHAVMDHGKRDVSDFPIATGTYYKVNYAPGTDISRYKNIPVPTSYMAYHSDFDFVGDYDHGKQAGMMHVANHHQVPGKKQWTWGSGEFGQAWDRQLTDEDGPYIELMCGAFTDNQPDFSWIMPGEERAFSQYFMPYKRIGPAKNANRDAVVNLEVQDGSARIGVYLSSPRRVRILLHCHGQEVLRREISLDPNNTYEKVLALPAGTRAQDLDLRVFEGENELIACSPLPDEKPSIPSPAAPAREPAEIESNEELFLNGLHLEQYRHASYAPEPYYAEALRRDPLDSRCNNAMGLLLYRRGKFVEAESYFRAALSGLTRRNPNPYDGEASYNLGLALRMQERLDEAAGAFWKATWNAAWQPAAYFELARLAARAGRFAEALDLLEESLRRNGLNQRARHLKIALLRRLGRPDEALSEAQHSLDLDPLDLAAMYERDLITGSHEFFQTARGNIHASIEIALDYAQAGLTADALELLHLDPQSSPMHGYFSGWCLLQIGQTEAAQAEFAAAARVSPDFCFPNHLESVPALQAAMQLNPQDARAPYYLGNFWYAHRQYENAILAWERAAELDPAFPTAWRNLGLAYYNKRGDRPRALQAYENAFSLDRDDARVFFELDQLRRKLNHPPAERLAELDRNAALVERRDDLSIEKAGLLNRLGRHAEALALLLARSFHPWEGGEGKTTGQYVYSLVSLARQSLAEGRWVQAVELLERAQVYPHNLGEGKLHGAQENHIFYLLGLAHSGLRDGPQAAACFRRAASGLSEPASAMFYNDQPPDMIFYQGLARRKLGQEAEARAIFQKLAAYGREHLEDQVKIDYFAVSLPDFLVFDEDLQARNRVHCHYMIALGLLGQGEQAEAEQHFSQVLGLDINHLGAAAHRGMQLGAGVIRDRKILLR